MAYAAKLFHNGHIITLDDHQPVVNSVLIEDGVILAVGNDLPPENRTEKFDLQGRVMIPGFTDAHVHLQGFGRFLEGLQLSDAQSADDIAMAVVGKASQLPPGEWILGRGWDQSRWMVPRFPGDELLNAAAPEHPVMLTRVDGHAIWVNRKARELAGFTKSSPLPDGGDVLNDCIFIDNAINIIQSILPSTKDETIERQIRLGAWTFAKRGLTGIHDVWQDERIIRVIRKLIDAGEFPLRCYGMLAYNDADLIRHYFEKGQFHSPFYTIRAVKTFMDGALGSRGAALLEPYSDDPENRGLLLMEREELTSLAVRCRDAGFQLCTHAIGDRGNRMVLDVYEETLRGVADHRWRIEHAQMIADSDMNRFSMNGIIPSLQPTHCTSDMRWLPDALGEERSRRISRLNSLLKTGVNIPGGSDCPIETGDPILEFYAAVTRQDKQGNPPGGWHPEERVSPLNALKMLTTWAAYAGFQDNRRGKIMKGFDADFTVLDQDITRLADHRILDTSILMTIVAGQIVYSAIS